MTDANLGQTIEQIIGHRIGLSHDHHLSAAGAIILSIEDAVQISNKRSCLDRQPGVTCRRCDRSPAARCESVYTQSTSPPADKDNHVLPSLPYALSRYGIPALRPQRAEAARRLARAVAQLRRRHAVRQRPRPDPLRLRSRHYPFRSGQQLRPAARCRGKLWPHSQRRSAGLAR